MNTVLILLTLVTAMVGMALTLLAANHYDIFRIADRTRNRLGVTGLTMAVTSLAIAVTMTSPEGPKALLAVVWIATMTCTLLSVRHLPALKVA